MSEQTAESDVSEVTALAEELTFMLVELEFDALFEVEQRGSLVSVGARCASPLSMRLEPREGQIFVYFRCRSTSSSWVGERTDVHDLFSVYLACRLAATGIASCRLIDDPHPAVDIPGEVYARYVVPVQPSRGWYPNDEAGYEKLGELLELLQAVESELHSLDGPCLMPVGSCAMEGRQLQAWGTAASEAFGLGNASMLLRDRHRPDWRYLRTEEDDISLVSSMRFGELLIAHAQGDVDENPGVAARLVRRGSLQNSWQTVDLERAINGLEQLTGQRPVDVLTIPLEDGLVVTTGEFTMSLVADTGRESFQREVDAVLRQHDSFHSWARPDQKFEWIAPISAARFEQMAYDLLSAMPGVCRVRSVGSTNDRDGGRDLLVDYASPMTPEEVAQVGPGEDRSLLVLRRIIVQCKTRRDPTKPVNKASVPDIRDTLEQYNADGYWLFVSSHITSQLIDHLEALQRKYPQVDWWTRIEIEELLRQNPRVAQKYSDVVRSNH
ncbi:restriction endonuclease [Nocardia salmonicida]|uniref:restriction endonuclease n=1 Tax=Nocardia salmonicida TaxID=53431 RepID=UPI00368C1B17